jgi:hypothetical protein
VVHPAWTLRLSSLALFVACSGVPTQTYPGPERARAEVALLRESTDANVIGLDGERTSGSSWLLLPGSHEVLLRVRLDTQAPNTNWTIWSYCGVVLDASAGGDYSSRVRTRKEVTVGLADRVALEVGIVDAHGALTTPHSCSPRRPTFDR